MSDQASAAVGATVGLYHIICVAGDAESGNVLEKIWKLGRRVEGANFEDGFARALEHAVDMTGTPVPPQSWGKAEVATAAKLVAV